MKTVLLFLGLIVIPEPIIFLLYLIMKKYFPEHPITLFLHNKVEQVKILLIKMKQMIRLKPKIEEQIVLD